LSQTWEITTPEQCCAISFIAAGIAVEVLPAKPPAEHRQEIFSASNLPRSFTFGERFDRTTQARRILKQKGLIYLDRFQKPKPQPEVAIELNNKTLFAALLKQIHLNNLSWQYLDD
jgi:hypothetical protein